MNKKIVLMALAGLIFASCADEESTVTFFSTYQRNIGKVDKQQTWVTADAGKVTVNAPSEGVITVYCDDDSKRVFLASQQVEAGEKTLTLNIPQHLNTSINIYGVGAEDKACSLGTVERKVMVEFKHGETTLTQGVSLSDVKKNKASVNFNASTSSARKALVKPQQAENAAAKKAQLTGKSGAKIVGYYYFPGTVLDDFLSALKEGVSAKNQVNNFDLVSNGKFLVSMFYGVTGNSDREVGYYYYDDDNNRIEVPFCNALLYDYLYDDVNYSEEDPIAKSQYKRDGKWYDVNYDHYDRMAGYSNTKKALYGVHGGDNAFVCEDEYKKGGIDEVAGVTFLVDVPVGKKLGFYCKGKDKKYKNGNESFYNHTQTAYNNAYGVTKYTAAIRVYNGYRFIGMEDTYNPSDTQADCNDIAFAIVPGGTIPDIFLPYVVDQTASHKGEFYNGDGTWTTEPKRDFLNDGKVVEDEDITEALEDELQKWLVAFEDMNILGDYDFNDIVIRVTPITGKSKAKVEICAVGASDDATLIYDDMPLGEVHYLIGVLHGQMVNTTYDKVVPERTIAYVDWDEEKTLLQNIARFRINNKYGDSKISENPGETPTAVCVSNEWKWPLERVRVNTAYEKFGEWGENYHKTEFQDWYLHYNESAVYDIEKANKK